MLVARGLTRRRLSRARVSSSLQFAYFYPARSSRHARARAAALDRCRVIRRQNSLIAFLTPVRATKLILNRVTRDSRPGGISDIDLYTYLGATRISFLRATANSRHLPTVRINPLARLTIRDNFHFR